MCYMSLIIRLGVWFSHVTILKIHTIPRSHIYGMNICAAKEPPLAIPVKHKPIYQTVANNTSILNITNTFFWVSLRVTEECLFHANDAELLLIHA